MTDATTRVALYIKAATMPQATDQAVLLHNVAAILPGWRIVAVFCDITTGIQHPARDGAITAATSGGYDVLLMTGLHRLTRDMRQLHDLIGQLGAASVTVCTVDSTAPTGPDSPDLVAVIGEPSEQATQRLRELTTGKAVPALAIGPAPAEQEQ